LSQGAPPFFRRTVSAAPASVHSECLAQLICRSAEGPVTAHPGRPYDGSSLADRQPEHAYEHNSLALFVCQLPECPSQINSQAHLGFGQFGNPPPLTTAILVSYTHA
jgi:hypothetical protein